MAGGARERLERWLGVTVLVAGTAVALGPVAARAQAPAQAPARGDTGLEACLARDTTSAWKRVAGQWSASSDTAGGWSNDSLRRVLLALGRRDQEVRTGPDLADSFASPAFRERMAKADSADATALQAIIVRFGWPTRAMVGVQGADAAFDVVQHNFGMQGEALRLMRALPVDQYSPVNYAMLDDRWLVAHGQPQVYGTQLRVVGSGPMQFDSIADAGTLDRRRAGVGLPPLDVYICMMRDMYGRVVEDPRPGAGAPR